MATELSRKGAGAKAARRALLKAQTEFETARRTVVRSATCEADGTAKDVTGGMGPLLRFTKHGMNAEIVFAVPETCDKSVVASVFELTKTNMQAIYDSVPGWHWNDTSKRSELTDSDTRFLLVRDCSSGALLAFASFRFVVDGDFEVLYLFELQLSKDVQRRGLGKHLMAVLECIARQQKCHRVTLTVLKANAPALDFYRRMRYVIDETSPDDDEGAPHEILSKSVNKALEAERISMLESFRATGDAGPG
jgi:ribosomal protein S18 acetylase RimI-like enzyme